MHIFQVGAGSGGMVVLDLLARDPRVTDITIVEPDVYKSHNVVRHYFAQSKVGELKAHLAEHWLKEMRPDLTVQTLAYDVLDSVRQAELEKSAAQADIGVCAVDNEPAKFHFDALMRKCGKPWTLGEVLSGGIGGWLHRFVPNGPCYGCVASHLQRTITTDSSPPPDYSNPGGLVRETTIPASKASINAIASLHALMTLELFEGIDPGFTSSLLTLTKVDGVFPEAFRTYKFRIAKSSECLICGQLQNDAPAGEELDVALDQALARLGHE